MNIINYFMKLKPVESMIFDRDKWGFLYETIDRFFTENNGANNGSDLERWVLNELFAKFNRLPNEELIRPWVDLSVKLKDSIYIFRYVLFNRQYQRDVSRGVKEFLPMQGSKVERLEKMKKNRLYDCVAVVHKDGDRIDYKTDYGYFPEIYKWERELFQEMERYVNLMGYNKKMYFYKDDRQRVLLKGIKKYKIGDEF